MLTRDDIETALDYMNNKGLIRLSMSSGSSSKWRQLHCPFHNNGNEKKPSCGCSLEEEVKDGKVYPAGTFHCFACNSKYPFGVGIKKILELKGTTIASHPDLEKYLEDVSNFEVDSLIPPEMMASVIASYAAADLRTRVNKKKEYVSEEELASYRFTVPYMYQRKLTDAVIEKYDVGFDGHHIPPGRKKELPCITFPVRDIQGNTLFICRRSIEGKYFNLPTNVEKSVYGVYELPKDVKEVIICESIFNALTCEVYGHHAIALLGTGSSTQIDTLKKLGVSTYVICLDNDEAGNKGADKLKKALKNTAIIWTMHVPEGKDVNDLTYSEFIEAYNSRE